MGALRSTVFFRTQLVDLTDELRSMNSTELPNGATLFDNESQTLWRLDKLIGDSLDGLIGSGIVLKPNDQTEARWIAESIFGSSPYAFQSYLKQAYPIAVAGQNEWTSFGIAPGTVFGSVFGNADLFTLNEETGVITYNGPDRSALITATLSVNNDEDTSAIAVHAVISVTGDVVAGSTTNAPEKGEQANVATDDPGEVTTQRPVVLSGNATYQVMFRNASSSDGLNFSFCQITITPL